MPRRKSDKQGKYVMIFVVFFLVIAVLLTGLFFVKKKGSKPATNAAADNVNIPVENRPVIDYNKLGKETASESLTQKRKTKYGLDKGVDMIVNSDESIKVGESTVPMQVIIDKIRLKTGEIVEKTIGSDADYGERKKETFGIYVVQKGDNIWNIHFNFLKDYFAHRGIAISPTSDEPNSYGYSSGVGKLLKFSEHIVNIYNIRENRLDQDINIIHPLSKLVVYNMTQVFELLDSIDYKNVNQIQFDGETLWISLKK